MEGRIYSTLSLSAVDGPGLRFVIFFQGCDLECLYCHNADSWDIAKGKLYSTDEIVELVKESDEFYKISNGGVTLSGGEPLLQPEFAIEILKKLKNNSYHTALDTSGAIELSKYPEITELTDLFIIDTKAFDKKLYKQLTNSDLNYFKENCTYLQKSEKRVWLRHVIVPGFTDEQKEIEALSETIKNHSNIELIQIIPYSRLGLEKWEKSGMEYKLRNTKTADMKVIGDIQTYLRNKHPDRKIV